MITCKELILKEEDGEIRTFYDLQTWRFFSCFFLFFMALCPITRFHFYSYFGSWVTSATVGPWGTQVAWTGRTASASRWREGSQPGRRRRCRERGATGHLVPMCGVRLSPQLAGPYKLFGACKLVPPLQQSWVRSPQCRRYCNSDQQQH